MKKVQVICTLIAFFFTFIFGIALSKPSSGDATLFSTIYNYYLNGAKDAVDDFQDMASGIEFHADGILDKEYNIKNNYLTVGTIVTNNVSTQFKIERLNKNLKVIVNHKELQVIDGISFSQQHSSQDLIIKDDWYVAKEGNETHYFAKVDSIEGEILTVPLLLELVGNDKSELEPFVSINLLEVLDVSEMDREDLEFISKNTSIFKFKGEKYAYKTTKWSAYCASF